MFSRVCMVEAGEADGVREPAEVTMAKASTEMKAARAGLLRRCWWIGLMILI